jgi:hypothetical protein
VTVCSIAVSVTPSLDSTVFQCVSSVKNFPSAQPRSVNNMATSLIHLA